MTTLAQAKKQLQDALILHEGTLAELRRIEKILRGETDLAGAARLELEAAEAAFADAVTAHELGETTADAVAAAEAALEQARDRAQLAAVQDAKAAMLASGAERRLQAAHEAEQPAREAIRSAEANYLLTVLVAADRGYLEAVDAIAKHAGRLLAAAQLLKARAPSLVPAATASHLAIPALPTLGPVSAAAVHERSVGTNHGIRQVLLDGSRIVVDTAGIERQMTLAGMERPLVSETA